jgi:hypothetical protein
MMTRMEDDQMSLADHYYVLCSEILIITHRQTQENRAVVWNQAIKSENIVDIKY